MKNVAIQEKKALAFEIATLVNQLDKTDAKAIYLVAQALLMKQEANKDKKES